MILARHSYLTAMRLPSVQIRVVAAIVFSFVAIGSVADGQEIMTETNDPIAHDSFNGGNPQLEWLAYPYFNLDNLHGAIDETSPEEDPGVGVLNNKNAGGFAALSYLATSLPRDFYLETWMHAQVSDGQKGPLNGVAFRIDVTTGNFYRLATQFTAEPKISLAYVGKETNHFPEYLAVWEGAAIPGGTPETSGWHKIAISIENDKAEVFWNGSKLAGGPFSVYRTTAGFVGVYANTVGGLGLAETKVDGMRVWARK